VLIRELVLSGPSGAWGWSLGSLFNLSVVRNLRLFGRDGYVCFEFPTLPQGFLWQVLLASLCCEHWGRLCPWCSIWQWSSISMSVWKVVFVCCSRRALLHIGVGLMGWCPGIYTWVGICGRVMHRDLWSFFYSRKGGAWMWLFPLCWQQQSWWRVLLLRAWCFHGEWDGRWRTQKIGRRRHWCLPQTLCPLGAHSSNGGFGVMVEGGCHFFFSDQGPLMKGGGDVGG